MNLEKQRLVFGPDVVVPRDQLVRQEFRNQLLNSDILTKTVEIEFLSEAV